MKNKLNVIILFSLFMLAIGGGFMVGLTHQKDIDLEHCKQAGWEFIEEEVFPKRMIEESLFGKEYALNQLRHLQSKVATKCIERMD